MKRHEPILNSDLSDAIVDAFRGNFAHLKSSPASQGGQHLSLDDEIFGLSLCWLHVKNAFAFWAQRQLDWDEIYRSYLSTLTNSGPLSLEDYYIFLQTFLATLQDGHTCVRFPLQLQNSWAYPNVKLDSFLINGRTILVVSKGALPRGTVILEVDDRPTDEVINDIAPQISASTPHDRSMKIADTILRRNKGTLVQLKAKLPNGQITSWAGIADNANHLQELTMNILDGNIRHVKIPHFQTHQVPTSFNELFHDFGGINGLILDVRQNRGGNSNNAFEILSRLISKEVLAYRVRIPARAPVLESWGMSDRFWLSPSQDLLLKPNDLLPIYDGPVVVLTSSRTYSAAEDFVISFRSANRGIIVGEPTGGSTGQSVNFPLPGGGVGQVVGVWDLDADEHEFVGVGITPDVLVSPTMDDYIHGRDQALEAAVSYIKTVKKGLE